jgi:hypothetical protein
MDNLNELYAACIVEYAGQQPERVLAGPSSLFLKDARDAFSLPYDRDLFASAMNVLEELRCLKKHTHPGMQSYYRLEVDKFAEAMKPQALDVRAYRIRSDFTKDGRSFPFLESYADLGSFFLRDALETCEDQLSQIGADDESFEWTEVEPPLQEDREPILVDSSAWTGLPPDFQFTEERLQRLVTLLDTAERDLDSYPIPNSQKAQARAYILAAKELAQAPEPPADLIWELIGRANSIAGIASLFVSIVALFS